jgi:hypothetical protein
MPLREIFFTSDSDLGLIGYIFSADIAINFSENTSKKSSGAAWKHDNVLNIVESVDIFNFFLTTYSMLKKYRIRLHNKKSCPADGLLNASHWLEDLPIF